MRDRGRVGNLLDELAAMVRQGALIARARRREARPLECHRAVLFVHGLMASGAVFEPLVRHVRNETGLAVLDFSYSSRDDFPSLAETLARYIRRYARDVERLSIVGHSLGGLLARWYVQEMGGADHVDRLVLLASPHGGTERAGLLMGPYRQVLRPGSAILERLADRRHEVGGVRHVVVAAERDTFIVPSTSAVQLSNADVHWIRGTTHNAMLFHPEVHRIVARALV